MNHETIIQTWIDYCREVLPDEWTITRAEHLVGNDSPRPQGPYITLKIISGPGKLTLDDELRFNGKINGNKNFNLVGQRSYTLSVQAFRSGSNDALETIATCLQDPDHVYFLRKKADIAITNRGTVTDITTKIETGYETRSTLDIFFNSSNNKETNVGLIETVRVGGVIKTESDKNILTNMPDITKE